MPGLPGGPMVLILGMPPGMHAAVPGPGGAPGKLPEKLPLVIVEARADVRLGSRAPPAPGSCSFALLLGRLEDFWRPDRGLLEPVLRCSDPLTAVCRVLRAGFCSGDGDSGVRDPGPADMPADDCRPGDCCGGCCCCCC